MPSTLFRPGLSGRGLLHDTLAQFTTSGSSLVRIPSTHTRSFSFNFAIPTSGITPGQFGPKFELFFKQQRRLSALVSVLLVVSIILFCLLLSLLTFFFCNRSRQARQKLQEEHLEGGLDQQRRWDTVKEFQFNNSNNNNRLAGYDSRREAPKHKSRRLLVRRRSQDDTWQMRLRRFIRGDKSTASLLPLSTSSGRRGNTEPLGSPRSDRGTAASRSDVESSFSTHSTVCTKSQANSVQVSLSGDAASLKRASMLSEATVSVPLPPPTEASFDTPHRQIGMRILSLHEIIARTSTTSSSSPRPASISSSSDHPRRVSRSNRRLEMGEASTINMSPTIPQFSDLGPSTRSLYRVSTSTTGGGRGGVTTLTNTNGPPTVGSLAFEKKEEWYGSERLPLKRPPPLVLKQEQKETVPTRQTFGAAFRPTSRDVSREPFSVRAARGGSSDVIRTRAEFRESGETEARSQQQQSSRAQASYSRRSFTNLSSLFSPSTPERRQNIRSNEFARASSAIVDLESAMSPRLR
ncbi:hypothetical protein FRB91_003815 [Serendipita sp. 411]|nr:hypothetical protein FRB91_003815 [Serendipita sp. 411]